MELAHILKHRFGLAEDALAEARHIQQEKGGYLGDILVQRQSLSETQLLEALSIQYEIPFWPELPMESIMGGEFAKRISIQFLKRHNMVPLAVPNPTAAQGESATDRKDQDAVFIVAVNDPSNFNAVDDLTRLLGLDSCKIVLSTRQAILAAINLAFDLSQDSAQQLVQDMEDESDIISQIEDTADLLEDTSDAPIIKLVNHILSQSIKARASDIHIEPYQDSFKVRYRVDGILYDLLTPPKWIQPALTSRIKVMSKLNIAEKRLPQDGRFEVKIGQQNIDVRVSTLPTTFGERVVMRLLNKSSNIFELSEIGLSKAQLKTIKELVGSPNGIILVTGPTGSGKTTTLYSVLSSINTPDIKIGRAHV
jgi:general secretion pathway protein E